MANSSKVGIEGNIFQENPSYQNYLANQLLLSKGSSSNSSHHLPLRHHHHDNASNECSEKLGSLLDVIDSVKPLATTTSSSTSTTTSSLPSSSSTSTSSTSSSSSNPPQTTTISDTSSPYDWIRHYDITHGQYYYYNYKTGVSQWEKPEDFIEPIVMTPTSTTPSEAALTTAEAATGYAATFNTRTGAFETSGGRSYWESVGRPNDREGRQLAAFFNLTDLERNREEAKMKKKELQHMKGFDWRKYKEERKAKRQKISQRWLYEDD